MYVFNVSFFLKIFKLYCIFSTNKSYLIEVIRISYDVTSLIYYLEKEKKIREREKDNGLILYN